MLGTKPDENIRRPMQWNDNGGFTTGTPWYNYNEDYRDRNIISQQDDPNSLLNHYSILVDTRNQHEALRIGIWQSVETDRQSLYSFYRSSDEEAILMIVNFSKNPVKDYSLSLDQGPFKPLTKVALLMGNGPLYAPTINDDGGFLPYRPIDIVPGYGTVMVQFTP